MMRQKGWAARYRRFNADQLRAEIRRIERTAYIFDREDKLAWLGSEVWQRSLPVIDVGHSLKPGAIVYVPSDLPNLFYGDNALMKRPIYCSTPVRTVDEFIANAKAHRP